MALFENFPYTNLHQLNLDWLVAEMKKVEDAIKYGPVISVNGLTGEVVLYQEANVRLPDVMNPTQTNWNIFRYLNGHVYGIEFDATGNVYQIEDQYRRKLLTWADIPPESGVISVNGKYGVVRLYGSDIQTSGDDTKTVMESIYDLEDAVTGINNSIDDLDELTSTLQTISNAIKNSMAYVENTNTATHNMSSGTYVLWNNGAYKIKSGVNIAIGDTLSSSNLDPIGTKGFINDLNDSITALNNNTIKKNVGDQTIENSNANGTTILRVKSDATTNAQAYMRADIEGGNFQAQKGNSVVEFDSSGLKDDGTGYGRIYTTANGSDIKTFLFKQTGDFVDGNSGKTVRSVEKSITTGADGHYAISNIATGLTIANIVNVVVTNAAYSALTFVYNGSGYLQFINTSGQVLTSAQTFTIKAYFVS